MKKQEEEWQFVEGFDDNRYSISSYGRVWCNGYISITGRRQKTKEVTRSTNTQGYKYVSLRDTDGEQTYPLVHRLVAFAFCGGYAEGLEVCHGDGTRTNNHHLNLRWDTRAANARDKIKDGTTLRYLHGEELNAALVYIYETRGQQYQWETGLKVGLAQATVGEILRGLIYKPELLALGLITQEQYDCTKRREYGKEIMRKYRAKRKADRDAK